MHWLLFIHKIIFSSTCFESQVLIFRRIQLCTCSIWHCRSLREFVVACRYTSWVRTDCRGKVVVRASYDPLPTTFPLQSVLTQDVYRQATTNSRRERQCHMLQVHSCILLKMSTWGSKHVQENIILWINKNQCIKLVIIFLFSPGATTPLGFVFYSPLAGFSLLAFEVSWSHTTTRHSR